MLPTTNKWCFGMTNSQIETTLPLKSKCDAGSRAEKRLRKSLSRGATRGLERMLAIFGNTTLMRWIDGLLTNQIAPLLPRSWTNGVAYKCLQSDSFPPYPVPLLAYSLPTSPQFCAHPKRVPASLAGRLKCYNNLTACCVYKREEVCRGKKD